MTSFNKMVIHLVVWRCVVSSGTSVLKNEISSIEDTTMEECFVELKNVLKKWDTWHVVVAGASKDQQRMTKILLENFSCLVIKDPKETISATGLGPSTVVVQFLTNVSEDYVTEVTRVLPDSRRTLLLLIFEGPLDNNGIESALRATYNRTEGLIFFGHRNKNSVTFYSNEPKKDCTMGAELITDWRPGHDLSKLTEFSKRVLYYHRCDQLVAAVESPPHMYIGYIGEKMDRKLRITGGTEGSLVRTVAWLLHFDDVIERNNLSQSVADEDYDNEWIISSCASRKTMIGAGQIRPNARMNSIIEMSTLHAREYIVWCVPRLIRFKHNVITAEFTWETWALIGSMFLVSLAVETVVREVFSLEKGKSKRSDFSAIFLDVFGINLGNTVVYDPPSRGGKLLLLVYLWYATIMTTSFKTSLASILTVETGLSIITDTKEIVKANLTTGGPKSLLYILKDQAEDDETTARLMARYQIEEDGLKAVRRVSHDQDFAYLTKLSKLAYYHDFLTNNGEQVSFDVLKDIVLTYSTVMILPKRSRWLASVNRFMSTVTENGLLSAKIGRNSVWRLMLTGQSDYSGGRNTTEELRASIEEKFQHIYIMFTILNFLCLLTFILELIIHKFQSKKIV